MFCHVVTYHSTNASPPKIMLKNSAGSSVVISLRVSQMVPHICAWVYEVCHTETAVGHRALLSELVILFPQVLVAEDLVRLADLCFCAPRSETCAG